MKRYLLTAGLVGLLGGCASHSARDSLNIQDPTVLQAGFDAQQGMAAGAPTKEWLDQYGHMDAGTMLPRLQERWNALGPKDNSYARAKAQCWIDTTKDERAKHNQWGFVQEAMGEADRLITGMESGKDNSRDNTKLRTAAIIRPDLWKQLRSDERSVKDEDDCGQVERILACQEVELMHAGHDAWRRSFDAAESRANKVKQTLDGVTSTVRSCSAKKTGGADVARAVSIKHFKVDALFRFNSGDEAGLLPEGRAELDRYSRELGGKVSSIDRVEVIGYTDRLGGPAYNQSLSNRRAETVERYLQKQLATPLPITHRGEGASNPMVSCTDRNRDALIKCLAPNRRVDVHVYSAE
ncbi:OmpA family protein [Dyella japonica]|uniref:OmpA-like domain-containing protein n=1 Tax=Dyella japonica DSM 16301 TaxID=1440762 RepID=A0A0G9H4C2_9GAMM|nr:OmpA family protein [Dyella japonica]KLD64084.1 hypothetical protein Y882_08345 [Dyella japonica DSM 16301]